MISISSILAAAFTFTASATGIEKGAAVEFLFIGSDSDRAYESMFTLDMPIADFAAALEKAGLPRGKPIDLDTCTVWPVGTVVSLEPAYTDFVTVDGSNGFSPSPLVYTGGTRDASGKPTAAEEMPSSAVSFYTLDQSLILPDGVHHQGDVYGRFKAAQKLEKGKRYAFKLTWDASSVPRQIKVTVNPGESAAVLKRLKEESSKGPIEVELSFGAEMTVQEATILAQAMTGIDSPRVKFNGRAPGTLFFNAFVPLLKWNDRKNRMLQPFELSVTGADDELVFIEEDWNVEGDDPKLSEHKITFDDAAKKQKTDTCFIYADKETKLSRIYAAMAKMKNTRVRTWYIFTSKPPSLHNPSYAQ